MLLFFFNVLNVGLAHISFCVGFGLCDTFSITFVAFWSGLSPKYFTMGSFFLAVGLRDGFWKSL